MSDIDFKAFSVREIRVASNTLANMHKSGGDMERATMWLSKIQPNQRAFWAEASKHIARGNPLSEMLSSVWPADILIAVKAGEISGTLTRVYTEIVATCKYTERTQQTVRSVLPTGLMIIGALCAAFFMLAFFVPMMEENFPSEVTPGYVAFGLWLKVVVTNYWPVIVGVFAFVIFAAAKWLNDPNNRLNIVDALIPIPMLGSGLLLMSYGKWARYMSIMHASGGGMAVWEQMRICASVLPPKLRETIIGASSKLESGGAVLSDVFTGEEFTGEDAKMILPPAIIDAFINGGESGNFDEQLAVASETLDSDGKEQFEAGIGVLQFASKIIGAAAVGIPLLLYVSQLGTAVTTATKSL